VDLDINLPIPLDDNIQMTLYRIVQESLNNIAKHANADQVWVRLHAENNCITLSIRDNGQGFELSSIPTNHFGVAIMRERAESIGSTLQIESALGKGTCISLYTPLIA
jgi:signal transduction histidine kinase